MDEKIVPRSFRVDASVAEKQAGHLAALRALRDTAATTRTLDDLERAARGDGNLMTPLRNCVRAYATIGEICGRLRGVFGAYRDPGTL
jgi:methylmalonyl-CoA mutase N-terminal domain/subunit